MILNKKLRRFLAIIQLNATDSSINEHYFLILGLNKILIVLSIGYYIRFIAETSKHLQTQI